MLLYLVDFTLCHRIEMVTGIFFSNLRNIHPHSLNLVKCTMARNQIYYDADKYITVENKPTDVDAVLIDGAALVHILQPKACCTFQEYISLIVKPYILRILDTSKRIDVIWDIYIDKSLKASSREKRGKGNRKLVRENTSIPRNWNDFLRDSENKKQLFDLISNHLKDMPLPENTVVVCNTIEETL
ncbi:unnamed protein product [Phaedon cochleariae]|uniref:Uncharacterized protein n=1 Tax=Phaedon cochleariae TaxID=80249 RepID=A0A9P0GKR6_PHACE|nr:unnamed protein product [Phaedon cochleariae]